MRWTDALLPASLCAVLAACTARAQDAPFDPLANLALVALPQAERAARSALRDSLGEIDLPTGRIVVADAFPYSAIPLAMTVPPGRYPVFVWRSAAEPTRIAMLELRLAACRPTLWMNARLEGQASLLDQLRGDTGFPVDSGTALLGDAEVLEGAGILGPAIDQTALDSWDERILEAFGDFSGLQSFLLDLSGGNIVVSSSGYGDGVYASYWGVDGSGCPCVLVTDFHVFLNGHAAFDWSGPIPPALPHDARRVMNPTFGKFAACGLG